MPTKPETIDALKARFANLTYSEYAGQTRAVASRESLAALMKFLKEERGFDLLVDVTCVDYLKYRDATERFGLVYLVACTDSAERLTVRVFVSEPNLTVPSMVPLWNGANWLEREVFDMFGIVFEGHPDLRRILMPDEFTAHPLRKDYPMQGRGERHNFPVLTRGEA